MAESRPWTRPQDWVSLLAGGYLALSPLWVDVESRTMWAMVVIGAAIVVMALIALALPGAYIDEWMTVVGGGVAIVAPWLFGYADQTTPAWTSWITGAIVAIAALTAVPASLAVYRREHHAT